VKNIIKKIISVVFVILFYGIAFFAGRDLAIYNQNSSYTRDAVVISRTHEAIYVEDITGNCWAFDLGSYQIGDCVQLTLSDNGTKEIKDDEILNVELIK